jgi:hypothetical protein
MAVLNDMRQIDCNREWQAVRKATIAAESGVLTDMRNLNEKASLEYAEYGIPAQVKQWCQRLADYWPEGWTNAHIFAVISLLAADEARKVPGVVKEVLASDFYRQCSNAAVRQDYSLLKKRKKSVDVND